MVSSINLYACSNKSGKSSSHSLLSSNYIIIALFMKLSIKCNFNHIVSMKDEKDYLNSNINALIKWWILLNQLQI